MIFFRHQAAAFHRLVTRVWQRSAAGWKCRTMFPQWMLETDNVQALLTLSKTRSAEVVALYLNSINTIFWASRSSPVTPKATCSLSHCLHRRCHGNWRPLCLEWPRSDLQSTETSILLEHCQRRWHWILWDLVGMFTLGMVRYGAVNRADLQSIWSKSMHHVSCNRMWSTT